MELLVISEHAIPYDRSLTSIFTLRYREEKMLCVYINSFSAYAYVSEPYRAWHSGRRFVVNIETQCFVSNAVTLFVTVGKVLFARKRRRRSCGLHSPGTYLLVLSHPWTLARTTT